MTSISVQTTTTTETKTTNSQSKKKKSNTHKRGDSITQFLQLVGALPTDENTNEINTQSYEIDVPSNESKYNKLKHVEQELRSVKVELKNKREKVANLLQTLKTVKEEKFKSEKKLISKLQKSQSELINQISSVKEQKNKLLRITSVEIDRLRSIIRVLQEQVECYLKGEEIINVTPNTTKNYMQYNSSNKQLLNLGLENLTYIAKNNNNKFDEDDLNPDFLQNENSGDDNNTMKYTYNKNQKNNNHNNNNIFENTNNDEDDDIPFPNTNQRHIDIRIITNGDGKTYPDPYSNVEFEYTGYIYDPETKQSQQFTDDRTNGKVFRTQLGRGSNIIGLEQALLSMTVGEKVKVYVPSRLGYGEDGAISLIPPHSDLIFFLRLVDVKETVVDSNSSSDIENNNNNNNNNLNSNLNTNLNNNNSNSNSNDNNKFSNIKNDNDDNNKIQPLGDPELYGLDDNDHTNNNNHNISYEPTQNL